LRQEHLPVKRQMRIIGYPSRGEDKDPVIASDSDEMFTETWDQIERGQISAFFGAEDTMNKDVGYLWAIEPNMHIRAIVECGHVTTCLPSGTRLAKRFFLPCRAFSSRAFGTIHPHPCHPRP